MIQVKSGENTGGREAIHRLLAAYGFSSRQQLCDHLNASKSTMANRYLRDSFPAEWVIQCALETGVSLLWLTTGQGGQQDNNESDNINSENPKKISHLIEIVSPQIDRATLTNGLLLEMGTAVFDSSLLPDNVNNLLLVHTDSDTYILDRTPTPPINGVWLVDIDGIKSMVRLLRLPGNRLTIQQGDTSFECGIDDIELIGRAIKTIKST